MNKYTKQIHESTSHELIPTSPLTSPALEIRYCTASSPIQMIRSKVLSMAASISIAPKTNPPLIYLHFKITTPSPTPHFQHYAHIINPEISCTPISWPFTFIDHIIRSASNPLPNVTLLILHQQSSVL